RASRTSEGAVSRPRIVLVSAEQRPYLILPSPVVAERGRPPGGGRDITVPSSARQRDRLKPRFQRLVDAMAEQRARLQVDVAGAVPELVLALEIAGSVSDFVRAVQLIEGAEWLGEIDERMEPDEDFYLDEAHLDSEIGGQLFLVMSDQRALEQIVSLWE